ncbi:hypothetical protein CPAV1605_1097 [seawater metagenome]|uniref:Uncharacterized protein n=1 Tax=seawater metagenome TaxID=1561972 RepID=A0A5E8CJJ1_9ZZZZ
MNNRETNSNLLKSQTVQLAPKTKIGMENLLTVNPCNIELPGGTLLQNGNVRIPILKQNEENAELELIENNNQDTINNGLHCIKYYQDNGNHLFYTVPENLPNLYENQKTYCKLSQGTIVMLEDEIRKTNIKFALQEDKWLSLYNDTKISVPTETMLEFRINGDWYKIKTSKTETFKL